MKMNKTLAAALAIVTASTLGLSGCGSAGGDVKKTADGKVQITMWHGFSEACCLSRTERSSISCTAAI